MAKEKKRGSIEANKKARKRAKVNKNNVKTVKEQVTNSETCRKCCKDMVKSTCSCKNKLNSKKDKRLPNKELSLVDRIRVIKEYEKKKKSLRVLAEQFSVGKSTVARILKMREIIRKEHESNKANQVRCRKKRKTESDLVNELVWKFFQHCKTKKVLISGPMLQNKARGFALDVGYDNFKASNGWLATFKKVHGIQLPYPKVVGAVIELQNGKKRSKEDECEDKRSKEDKSELKNSSNDAVSDNLSIVSETEPISVSSIQNVVSFYTSDDVIRGQLNHQVSSFNQEQEQVNASQDSEMTQQQMMNLIKTAYNYAVSNDETLLVHILNLRAALEASIAREQNNTRRNTAG